MLRGLILILIIGLAFDFLIGESLSRESSSEKVSNQRAIQKPEGKPVGNGPSTQVKETSEKPYTVLVEKNIFSPERKEFPIQVVSPMGSVKKPPARPQVVLYGVTLAGDYQSASIVQPGRPLRKGERELMTLKVGDKVGEYQLTKILSDRITLAAEEDSFDVLLYDATKTKMRTATRTESKPASVTSALTGPASAEPTRPGGPGVPIPEIPRPTAPSPIPTPERMVPPPLADPTVPPAIIPSTAPTPQPVTPSPPPVYPPRRRIPIPGSPSPEATPQQVVPRESGGPS